MTRSVRPGWRWIGAVALAAVLFERGTGALAHGGGGPAASEVWSHWDWQPVVLIGLLVSGLVYGRGVTRLWRRAGAGRGVRWWQPVAFGGGLVALAVALVSPVAGLAEELFAVHMAQHLLLLLVAPPLLLVAEPRVAMAVALPRRWRRFLAMAPHRLGPALARHWPAVLVLVWFTQIAVLWGWHLPWLFETALRIEAVHALEHVSFVVTAMLFWAVAIAPFTSRRPGFWAAILFVVATALPNGLLGALMTLASGAWYPVYAERVTSWGLTPLQDQQIAGLLMWIPPGLAYVIVVAALLLAWLERGAPRPVRTEPRPAAAVAGEVGT